MGVAYTYTMIEVEERDEEKVKQALDLLGITQDQYNTICNRWSEFNMMDLPTPFTYGDSGYFRGWSVNCLNNSECRRILEEEVGVENLPDFSEYVKNAYPHLYQYVPETTILP